MFNKSYLEKICRLLRYDILTATTKAGSGHPSSCLSAVELLAVLFFGKQTEDGFFLYDLKNPSSFFNDRIIFSKGHSAPLLYSLYHLAGMISYEELLKLRKFDSPLEGHPTPRFPFVEAATGSLGQGLSVGVGMAVGMKLKVKSEKLKIKREPRVYVLLGDSEMAEGQVWEAMEIAGYYKLNNLIGIIDVNRLGQRGETMLGWKVEEYEKRIASFDWRTIVVNNGHNLEEIYKAYEKLNQAQSDKPTMIIAKTVKGKGVSFLENQEGWHGKSVPDNKLQEALKEIGKIDFQISSRIQFSKYQILNIKYQNDKAKIKKVNSSNYRLRDQVATREAYGDALVALGKSDNRIVVLDAEVSNSTFAEKFKKEFPQKFFEMFIAEQNMISTALGLSKLGFVPFVSSFSAFLTRGFDQLRMAQYSNPNIKVVGSHCGVSIGPDGPSQMGLEDLAMIRVINQSVVFYPSDAVSTFKLTQVAAENQGLFYIRTTRDKTPVIYDNSEEFRIGGSKVHYLKTQNSNVKTTAQISKLFILATAGICVHEALKAQVKLAQEGVEVVVVDCYSVKPIDSKTILSLITSHQSPVTHVIVVEDHYPAGGLGEAIFNSLITNNQIPITKQNKKINFHHLCVRKMPRSGTKEELLAYEEIDATSIIKTVKNLL